MAFDAAALNSVLDMFSIVLTWTMSTFVELMGIIIDSPLVIPIGIGLAFAILAVAYKYLRSIGK